MKKALLTSLIQFIKKPEPLNKQDFETKNGEVPIKAEKSKLNFLEKAWGTIRITGLQFIIAITLGVLISIILSLFDLSDTPSAFDQFLSPNMIIVLVISAAIIAPIQEEITFRTPLRFSPLNFAIFIASQIYFWQNLIQYVIQDASTSEVIYYFGQELEQTLFNSLLLGPLTILGLSLILFIFFKIFFKDNSVEKSAQKTYKKIFPYLLYTTAILFGSVHIFNYLEFKQLLPLAIILVSPQLFLGLTLGYIRTKFGLFWAIISHAIHNAVTTLPLAILILATETFPQLLETDPDKIPDDLFTNMPTMDLFVYLFVAGFFMVVLITCVILIIQMVVEALQKEQKFNT